MTFREQYIHVRVLSSGGQGGQGEDPPPPKKNLLPQNFYTLRVLNKLHVQLSLSLKTETPACGIYIDASYEFYLLTLSNLKILWS